MREQVKTLHKQLDRLATALLEQPDPKFDDAVVAPPATTSVASCEVLRDKYLALTLVIQRLIAEEYDLKKKLRVQQEFSASLQKILLKGREEWIELSWQARVNQTHEHVPECEIFRVMHECFDLISKFELSKNYISSGMSFLGWHDKRRLDADGSVLNFSFSKFFAGRLAEPMMMTTWEFFTDEDRLRKEAEESGGRFSSRVLQQPNADVVLLEQLAESCDAPRMVSVLILFRLRVGKDFMIVVRTFPMPSIQESLQAEEMWIDLFYWTHFKVVADGTEVTWGGSMSPEYFPSMSDFLVSSFGSVVAWENACITPAIILSESELHE
ncbi:hypothetical protein ATCC90586_002482 [Pythium insidiosum]|nr:hypothetical protein ATCC90586_002482 [Pythium insidiosum]